MIRSTFDPPEFTLTEAEAFAAMSCFLDQFVKSAGDDMATLLADISIVVGNEPWQPDGGTHDPAAWYDWLRCIEQVKGVEPSARRTFRPPESPRA